MAPSEGLRVGVLSLHNSKETKAILNAVAALGHQPVWLREENTAVEIADGQVLVEPEVDVVANRLLLSNSPQPCEELGLAKVFARARPMLNSPSATMTAFHKYASAVALADAGVPVPDALLSLSTERLNEGRDRYGEEVVFKTAIGTHGGGTWKVGPNDPVNAVVGNRRAFLQRLIERNGASAEREGVAGASIEDDSSVEDRSTVERRTSGGTRHHDLRVYVVGDQIVGAMNRYAPEGDWRTNVALGGEAEDAGDELPDEVVDTALTAREVIGLDYAGVDIIEGDDGWFVLEVNPTAGFKGLFGATGISPAPYIARQAIELGGGTVDDDRVVELSKNLDDSVPASKPRLSGRDRYAEPVIIGYTEEVIVSGTSGSTTAIGKADTGATRTSIDTQLAADIGAGPIKDITRVRSGSVKSGKSRPLVDIVVGVGGNQHTVTASIEDRSHMDHPLLLGRDILEHYQVDVRKRADRDVDDVVAEEE